MCADLNGIACALWPSHWNQKTESCEIGEIENRYKMIQIAQCGRQVSICTVRIVQRLLNRRRSEHFDAEITILTIILILGVFEAVTAVIVFRISYPSNLPRQESSDVPVAVPMQRDIRLISRQTVSPEAQDSQPQIVMSPDSRERDDPPPPYESVALGYQTVQADFSRSYTSVAIPAGDGIVEFQTVSSEAQGDQPQIVQLSGSLAIENTPPPYEDVASGYQTSQVDILPPYDEAVNENLTFNA